jgi:Protein of unknown function (DUF3565)
LTHRSQKSKSVFDKMQKAIVGFHQDEHADWVAELECGHNQHVRHDPPWQNRPWTSTKEGRLEVMGRLLGCKKCDTTEPKDNR